MDKINIGIVGLGTMAENVHIPVLSTFDDVIIKSAAEVDTKRGEEIARKWDISKVCRDYNELFDDSELEAVFICLPNFLHYDAVKGALEHNFHVFCEKPMALSAENAYELVLMAKKKNLIFAVGYNRRLERNYEEAAKTVKSLRLGKILQAHGSLVNAGPYTGWMPSSDWFFNDKYGVLYDSGPHLVDLILNILSDRIMEVSAHGISTMQGINVYDNISGTFKTEHGILGSFNIGWRAGTNYDSIQVHGTGGSVFSNPTEIEIRHGNYGSLERVENHIKFTKKIIGKLIRTKNSGKSPNETYFREDRAFVNAIRDGSKPAVTGEDGLRVLEVLEGIRDSLDERSMVDVRIHEL